MSEDLVSDVKNAISVINDPHMGVSIVEMGIVQDISVNNSEAKITLKPTNPGCMSIARVAADTKLWLKKLKELKKLKLLLKDMQWRIQ